MTSSSSRPRATCLAACAMALLGFAEPAAAYQIFWPNQTFEQPDDPTLAPPPRKPPVKRTYPKMVDAPKTIVKPHGPLIITISIEKQHLKIYDANGLFAESPVSTGMRGHATPMGVFSIIQKSKWHRSNLYSDAPMPYMQRITWSGVALHAGVLPGYPASHGCIRMPMAFATKLWVWTRLGARVIVAPDDVAPQDIAHPVLFTHAPDVSASLSPAPGNPAETSAANPETRPEAKSVAKSDKAAALPAPADSSAPELRLTSKHDDAASPADAVRSDALDRVRLANAGSAMATATTSEPRPDIRTDAHPAAAALPSGAAGSVDPAKSDKPAQAAAADAASGGAKDAPRPAAEDTPREDARNPLKDQSRSSDTGKDAAPTADTPVAAAVPKRTGHIAVLISRKDNRLYVRQNFEPLFDVPVTIAQNDRPLGTHIFTARADGDTPGVYRWSVLSLPARRTVTDDAPPRRRHAATESPAPPASPTAAEALSRLVIPDDAMTRIASALASGGSIIVSDQGPGGETGQGTDFIVPLR